MHRAQGLTVVEHDVGGVFADVRDLSEHALYDAVAQSHTKFEDGNLVVAMDLHKVCELFELCHGEGIWMGETPLVNRRAYAPFRFEHAVLVEPCTCEVSVDIARDHEGVSVLRKMPQPVHERAGLILDILLLMEPLGPSASYVCIWRGEPLQYAADAVGLGEVPVRLSEMGVGAEEIEPLRHVEPVAGADDDKIRLGKCLADTNRFYRFHALPTQRLAHVGEHVGDIGANGEPPILDRTGEKLRPVVHGDVASLR